MQPAEYLYLGAVLVEEKGEEYNCKSSSYIDLYGNHRRRRWWWSGGGSDRGSAFQEGGHVHNEW